LTLSVVSHSVCSVLLCQLLFTASLWLAAMNQFELLLGLILICVH